MTMTNPTNATKKPEPGCGWDAWVGQVPDKRFWAFFYYCKREGDKVSVTRNLDGTANLHRAEAR